MIKLIPSLLLCLAALGLSAQRSVQELYLGNEGEEKPDWFTAYCNGDYERAYQLLLTQTEAPPKAQFLANAFQYAHRKKALQQEGLDIWAWDFYQKYGKPSANFKGGDAAVLPLERNLFLATRGADTLRVLFDTGGHGISISKHLVEKYDLPTDTSITGTSYMPAFKRVSTTSPTVIDRINFGGIELSNLPAQYTVDVQEDGQFASQQKYDVFMGIDILVGLIDYVRFDWETKELTLSKEALEMQQPQPFFFFDSKPITVLYLDQEPLSALFDTGSPVDILNRSFYEDRYTQKEEKKYGNYAYHVYTVPLLVGASEFDLGVADYMEGFDLKLDGEVIDLIIGTGHQRLTLDLVHNRLAVE
ncbi:MAG: retropepsin-like aspartic protease [Bacteroidota bacterium]